MAEKMGISWELKYKFAMGIYASGYKRWLYAIREEYGAAAALKMFERVCKMDDTMKSFTKSILTTFKLEGNDAETIANWWAIWFEIIGTEYSVLECSKAISRLKITKCTFKTEPKDLCDWDLIFSNIVVKAINPKAVFYEPKRMCAGDPYCEFVNKIEE